MSIDETCDVEGRCIANVMLEFSNQIVEDVYFYYTFRRIRRRIQAKSFNYL